MPVSKLFMEIYQTLASAKCAMGDHFDQSLARTQNEENIDPKLFESVIKITDNYLEYITIFQAIAMTKVFATYQQTPIYLDVDLDDDVAVRLMIRDVIKSM